MIWRWPLLSISFPGGKRRDCGFLTTVNGSAGFAHRNTARKSPLMRETPPDLVVKQYGEGKDGPR